MKNILSVILILLLVATVVFPEGCVTSELKGESNRWLELLNILPANESTYSGTYLRDDAYKTEITRKYPQVVSPLSAADSAYVIPLFGNSPNSYSDEAWMAELGFTKADVDKSIYSGIPPNSSYQSVFGRFDINKIDNAAKNGPYKIIPEILNYNGYQFYSWGADSQLSLSLKTPARPLGIGNRMALINNFLFWVPTTMNMQEMIDSYANKTASLADIESYQKLSRALIEANTFRAFFSSVSYSRNSINEQYKNIFEQQENTSDAVKRFIAEIRSPSIPLLKPFEAIATGVGIDEKGYYLIIALSHSNASTAKQNTTLLEQRIKQSTELYSGKKWVDITGEMKIFFTGQVTVAKLYGEAAQHWNEFDSGSGMVQPLVVHE